MTDNPHFASIEGWADAEALIGFPPLQPSDTAGFMLDSLRVHVMDYRLRQLPPEERTLEAHYGGFVFTQSGPGREEARRLACDQSYGAEPKTATVGPHEARAYEAGPVPEPDDPAGQMPPIVAWADGDRFLFMAGVELELPALLRIAGSIYS